MARKPRVHFAGAVYHVMLRGNAGQDVFFGDEDRCRFLLLIQEGTARFGYRVHGFCLMTNHVHLALQIATVPLSRCMQNLSFRYTRWVNQRQRRTGHLFQGRYKAVLVEQDSYLLELVRYIHLNPVRAGIVANVLDYPWSGHRAYLGGETIPWLTIEWVLGQFSGGPAAASAQYEAFVRQGVSQSHREEFHRGSEEDSRLLGEDRFIEGILAQQEFVRKAPPMNAVIAEVCKEYAIAPSRLGERGQRRDASEARAMLGWLTSELGTGTLTDVAARCRRDLASMSSAVRRLQARSEVNATVRERMTRLRSRWD